MRLEPKWLRFACLALSPASTVACLRAAEEAGRPLARANWTVPRLGVTCCLSLASSITVHVLARPTSARPRCCPLRQPPPWPCLARSDRVGMLIYGEPPWRLPLRSGLLPREAKPLEHAWVRVGREAVGPEAQVVPQQWLARTSAPPTSILLIAAALTLWPTGLPRSGRPYMLRRYACVPADTGWAPAAFCRIAQR